ncbi:DUF4129 domain-containing protein [Pontibacillus salicampi]|uniref:DUF4129 domain-containing protein n=1 Tax=Pontibacillus salicampi TaxID=1449801 RepID=A0ABV6LUF8_9BACI
MTTQPNNAREELKGILQQEEYQVYYEEQKGIMSLLRSLGKWLLERFQELFPGIRITDGTINVTMIVIGIIGIALFAVLVFLIQRNLTSQKTQRNKKAPLEHANELEWSYTKHLQEAEAKQQGGEYTVAARHIFLALLLYFDEQKWVEARAWKTNWDYYDELKKVDQSWAEQFYEMALLFDEITYGTRKVTQEELSSYEEQAMGWLNRSEQSS